MKKVFCLLKCANQYLLLAILCTNSTLSAQVIANISIKLLYKNNKKILFRNSINQSLSIEKNDQNIYYVFQNNKYSIKIIKSDLKMQNF